MRRHLVAVVLGLNETDVAAHTSLGPIALIDLLLNSSSYSNRSRS